MTVPPGLPATPSYDLVVVGGGIVGLATAYAATANGLTSQIVERGPQLANHQTPDSCSNVIHSGLYYAPGGYKAPPRDGRVRGDRRASVLPRARPAAPGVRQARRRDRAGAAPGSTGCSRRGTASGVENHRSTSTASPRRTRAGRPRPRRAVEYPRPRVSATTARSPKLGEGWSKKGRRRGTWAAASPFTGGPPDVVVRTDAGDLLGAGRGLRRAALR
ncbi:FAD-dependent oxidoreductase [Pseudonocardia sp. MCCB 268]|nr:FAD-dependent oxidoreductase [Pseudonocardia cytotoxica]